MSKNGPQCNFNTQALSTNIGVCVAKPSIVNCLVKPVAKAALDPCFQQHMVHQQMSDPFWQGMPEHNPAAAAIYSAQVGGENYEPCSIM